MAPAVLLVQTILVLQNEMNQIRTSSEQVQKSTEFYKNTLGRKRIPDREEHVKSVDDEIISLAKRVLAPVFKKKSSMTKEDMKDIANKCSLGLVACFTLSIAANFV